MSHAWPIHPFLYHRNVIHQQSMQAYSGDPPVHYGALYPLHLVGLCSNAPRETLGGFNEVHRQTSEEGRE
jgi:hypothetical protein